jgi:hypothetical protein
MHYLRAIIAIVSINLYSGISIGGDPSGQIFEGKARAQCYKTFYDRNLLVFILS